MSTHRWAAKRDVAETPIRKALEAVGAEVWQISGQGCPDLLVRFRGQLWAAEVKTGKGRLRTSQKVKGTQQSVFTVWRTPEEALRAIGALQEDR